MSEEINFLPEAAQPKKKKPRGKEEQTVEFSSPVKIGGKIETGVNPVKKSKGGFGRLFSLLKGGDKSQSDSSVDANAKEELSGRLEKSDDINRTREDLLKEIRSKGEKFIKMGKEDRWRQSGAIKEKGPDRNKALNLESGSRKKLNI